MKQRKIDDRLSFWDLHIMRPEISGRTYQIEGEPERGASCLVYRAKRFLRVGEKEYEQKILLKEFYPLLNPEEGGGICRKEDGSFHIPEVTKESLEYQTYLERFHASVEVMLEMGNSGMGADHGAIPMSVMEAYGTWYVEEIDDSGHVFTEVFGGETKNYNFRFFLEIYKKAIWSLKRLHEIGYYHLDYNPGNLSLTSGGNVKLFDTDTFIKAESLNKVPIERYTEGYAAPELLSVVCHRGRADILIGPWTDIYSMTQVLCWYLYGHPLDELEVEEELEYLEEKIQDTFDHWGCQLNQKGVESLKGFIRANLSIDYELRFPSTGMAYMDIGRIEHELFEIDEEIEEEEQSEWEEIRQTMEEDSSFIPWNRGKALLRFVIGSVMLFLGGVMLTKAAFLMTHLGEIGTSGIWLHMSGVGMFSAGILLVMYCLYEYWKPFNGWQFIKEYYYSVLATIAAVFAYTMPAFCTYRTGFPSDWWKTMDVLQKIVEGGIACGGIVMLFSWAKAVKYSKARGGKWLVTISVLLFILSLVHILALTKGGVW